MNNRLRRSLHFVPGANEKMLTKSIGSAADSLILDLEDAVTPERKDDARAVIASWLSDVDFAGKERIVRFNPLDTPWGEADLRELMAHPPDGFLMPKVSTLAEIETVDQLLTNLEREHGHASGTVSLMLIATETPAGVLNLPTFTQCPRVRVLTWGAEDLSAAIGAPRNRLPDGNYLDVFRFCRIQTLLSAKAGGAQAIDAVYVDIQNTEALAEEAQHAAWMGFTGKMTIHPDQIPVVNAAFTPTAAEVQAAEELLAAFKEAQADGRMAFQFRGQMVDAPHLHRTQNTVLRAQLANDKLRGQQDAKGG